MYAHAILSFQNERNFASQPVHYNCLPTNSIITVYIPSDLFRIVSILKDDRRPTITTNDMSPRTTNLWNVENAFLFHLVTPSDPSLYIMPASLAYIIECANTREEEKAVLGMRMFHRHHTRFLQVRAPSTTRGAAFSRSSQRFFARAGKLMFYRVQKAYADLRAIQPSTVHPFGPPGCSRKIAAGYRITHAETRKKATRRNIPDTARL